MGHWEDFTAELNIVEAKYWKHFRHNRLSDEYILTEDEFQQLSFVFTPESELPAEIKLECLQIFEKYKSSQLSA